MISGTENIGLTDIEWSFETLAVTLTLNTAIKSFHKTLWLIKMHHQTKFGSKMISSSENSENKDILILRALTVTLTLKIAVQPHQFCDKMLNSLEGDIF